MSGPRVFGSVARGEDNVGSDVDLLVDVEPGTTGFDLGGACLELTELLGVGVDLPTCRAPSRTTTLA
ncbi:MAG: nucleotidyltransferase domain-containing protein [Bifidobacteriaceae bacterium]|nr:nucleotidyltransferase domain-containing protein [Bifidobacteriaceae bacterium]